MHPLLVFDRLLRRRHAIHERVGLDLDEHDLQRVQGEPVVEVLSQGAQPGMRPRGKGASEADICSQ